MYLNLRLFKMTRGLRMYISLAAFLGLLALGASIARLSLTGLVIAKVFQGDSLDEVIYILASVGLLVIARVVLQYARDNISYVTASRTKIELRRRLYSHTLDLGPSYMDGRRTGDVLVSLVDGVESLEVFFGQYLPQFIVAAVAPLLIFIFMMTLDIQIGAIFLFFASATLAVPWLLKKWNLEKSRDRRGAYGALSADFLDSVQGLATLKAFGQAKMRGRLLAHRARELYRTTMGVVAVDGSSTGATTLAISAGAATALIFGGVRVTDGSLEMSTLLIVLMLGGEIFRPIRELSQLYHEGMVAMSAAEGIFNLLDEPVTISGTQLDFTPEVSSSGMSFESVTFGYQRGRESALKDLTFTLREGERLGVVGHSGAGKSTIVWLALRFYDPQSGRVLLGGKDIRNLPIGFLREQISVVTQDTYLFHGTVAENLRLGNHGATQDDLEEATVDANAHEFIMGLPFGYDTVIGERGVRLSGGQRQRIAIARALLKSSPILILDEALSSVDSENEAAINEALERLMVGKTTLIIAHRLSSVINADRILVLENGKLIEKGSPNDLSVMGSAYYNLMANQQTDPKQDIISDTLIQDYDSHRSVEEIGDQPVVNPSTVPAKSQIGSVSVWNRLLSKALRWKGRLIGTLVLGVAGQLSNILLGVIGSVLVATVFIGGDIFIPVLVLGASALLSGFFRWGENWTSHDMAYRLLAEMRIELYQKLEPLAPAYMARRRSGDLTSIIGTDVESVENFFAHVITPAFAAVLVPAGVIVTLAIVSWPLALVLMPFTLIAVSSPFYEQKRLQRLGSAMRNQLGEMNAHMVDGIQGMREILAFGAGNRWIHDVNRMGWIHSRHRISFLNVQAFHHSFIEALTAFAGLAVLTTGVWMVMNGDMNRTLLPLVTLLALTSFTPVSEVSNTLKQLMDTLAATRRILHLYDEPVLVKDGPGVSHQFDSETAARFKEVSFTYDPKRPYALKDVTFNVNTGQTVALVGRSGAGKSTSGNLLLRFWDPDYGHIQFRGENLRDFELEDLRANIAMVSQDTYLFNTTIRENLRMARLNATDSEVEKAARSASVDEFADNFPDGYDTLVGERGVHLSGGQRQRVSIARAILKDAPVLILDEATSHLDAVNERQIKQSLKLLMQGRTTIVIAHRLSTVRDADLIVVLDAGRVVEVGNHRELLSKGGLYSKLVSRQMLRARS